MKILFVEDHPGLAEISCRLLRDVHGHEVRHALTGTEALHAARTIVPDIALIDMNLPDMDGYEVAEALRADPRYEGTVLVALTGFGNLVDDAKAAACGIDRHFRKPLDFELLGGLKRRGKS